MNSEFKKKYHKYLKSDEWITIKIDLIEIRGSKCERCGNKREPKHLQVHHLTYDNIFNEEPEDLELICGRCHGVEHGKIKIKPKKPKRVIKPKKKKFMSYAALLRLEKDGRKFKRL
jgi:5-methylcytosine-specific restriction endonuclease McrA